MNEQLFLLEQAPEDKQILAEIFRSAHTLKGMSASMGFEEMASLTHSLENVLDQMREEVIEADEQWIDLFLKAVDSLEQSLNEIRNTGKEIDDLNEIMGDIKQMANQGDTIKSDVSSNDYDEHTKAIIEQAIDQGISIYLVRVVLDESTVLKGVRAFMAVAEVEQLGELLHTSPVMPELEEGLFEQHFSLTVATGVDAEDVKARIETISEVAEAVVKPYDHKKKISKETNKKDVKSDEGGQQKTIRVHVDKLDELMYLFEELVIERGRLDQLAKELQQNDLTDTAEKMSRTIGYLQDVMLSVRMMPLETIFSRYPRMVRQVSKEIGKQIQFDINGAQTEIDRAIIDELGDPLLHLLRNSMDHGIELPDIRIKAGKSATGSISLNAFYSGDRVMIEIKDDGNGIQREKVLDKAISKQLINKEQAEQMIDEEVYQLLFEPGFSTASEVTDLSGRGVGLDVVKTSLASLGGQIAVSSAEGEGSTFSISMPLTVSIMEVMLVKLDEETYAIPASSIVETMLLPKNEIHNVDGKELIDVRGHLVPLYSLKNQFGLIEKDSEEVPVVVLYQNNRVAAIKVDSFIDHQEIVLKPLGELLQGVEGISGATILGDGTISMIIDPSIFFMHKRGVVYE